MGANGFLAVLWSSVTLLPFFLVLLVLGIIKAVIVGTLALIIVLIGNSSVIIGLWPAHVIWTYYCVIKTKRVGLVLKIIGFFSLPIPLVMGPIFGILGSLLGGIGYGYAAPLVATFEAVGEQMIDKVYHSFADGCRSTIEGACTVVRDCTDFCFHSYFAYMDDLSENIAENEKPYDIELSMLPCCVLVCLLAIPIDVPMITAVALWKSPYMLFRGWHQFFHDLFARQGPFQEKVCLPFAIPAIVLWPIAVLGGVISSFFCSLVLGCYAAVVVYQERSFRMGLAYIISVIAIFDEYTNDLLYFREGSCLPRPQYRKTKVSLEHYKGKEHNDLDGSINKNSRLRHKHTTLVSQHSATLKQVFKRFKPVQIWDWLFRSCEVNGRILLRDSLINVEDIADCVLKGSCKKLSIRLPAWCILQCLLRSAKSDTYGLLINEDVELTDFNWPEDKIFEWLFGPLVIIKEQIKELQLTDNEEACLRTLIMTCGNQRPEDWNDSGFPSDDNVRRAQLQAIIRRIQGMVISLSRFPTFRRRFHNLVKALYLEAVRTGAIDQDESSIKKGVDSSESSEVDVVEANRQSGSAEDILDVV